MEDSANDHEIEFARFLADFIQKKFGPRNGVALLEMALGFLACSTCYSDSTRETIRQAMADGMSHTIETLFDLDELKARRSLVGPKPTETV